MNRLIVSLVWGVLFVSTGFDGIHAAAQSQGVPSIDDLYSSIKSHREEIVSGSMTYRFLEHDYGTENNAVSPETPPDEAAYLLGPRTQEALCTLEFKKRGDILLWRMSCRNVRDNKDVSPDIVQKFDLDYQFINTFDGKTYYRISYRRNFRPELHIFPSETRYGFGRDILLAAGVPWGFQSDESFAYLKSGKYEHQVSEIGKDCVRIDFRQDSAHIQSATLGLQYNGLCFEQESHKILRNPHTGVFFAYEKPDFVQSFSGYLQISGIWFPMRILEERYDLSIKEESAGETARPSMNLVPTLRTEIHILGCDFNGPIDETRFQLVADDTMEVYDHRKEAE